MSGSDQQDAPLLQHTETILVVHNTTKHGLEVAKFVIIGHDSVQPEG